MQNIKAFNLATADIFSLLYGEFPLKIEVFKINDFLEQNPREYNAKILLATLEFLEKEKFIEWSKAKPEHGIFVNLTLTLKGLSLLNKTPSELKEAPTTGESVFNAIKKGAFLVASETIKNAIARLF